MWIRRKKCIPVNFSLVATFELRAKRIYFKDSSGNTFAEWGFANENEACEVSTNLMKKIGVIKI